MTKEINCKQIGRIGNEDGQFYIELDKKYKSGLKEVEGFTHLQILWWGHLGDNDEKRETIIIQKPYVKGPNEIGVFATRSESRPNPILITNVYVIRIDYQMGRIYVPYVDAEVGTPVLDIKPYYKSERIKDCEVPAWCNHWPKWYEDAGNFDWEAEFNF